MVKEGGRRKNQGGEGGGGKQRFAAERKPVEGSFESQFLFFSLSVLEDHFTPCHPASQPASLPAVPPEGGEGEPVQSRHTVRKRSGSTTVFQRSWRLQDGRRKSCLAGREERGAWVLMHREESGKILLFFVLDGVIEGEEECGEGREGREGRVDNVWTGSVFEKVSCSSTLEEPSK